MKLDWLSTVPFFSLFCQSMNSASGVPISSGEGTRGAGRLVMNRTQGRLINQRHRSGAEWLTSMSGGTAMNTARTWQDRQVRIILRMDEPE